MSTSNGFVKQYTPESIQAQLDWNKEIENNKQGYMGVDIMSMKDFYDAGGYTFIDDYRGELADVDAAYERAIPGYGVQGEQMAKAGLTGTGYSDYMAGQAYAGRVAGQAVARANAMSSSKSFRSAYNQYVQSQKDQQEANLQTVIEKAQSVNMDPDMFIDVATKLGIPQTYAERGKDALVAYYQSIGLMPSDSTTTTGSSSTTGTTGTTGTSWTGKLTTAQKQAAAEMATQLGGAIAGATDTDGNVVIAKAPTLDAALSNLYGSTYSMDDPVVQEAVADLRDNQIKNIVGAAQRGSYNEAATYLKEVADYGLFGEDGKNSEEYKAVLSQIQAASDNAVVKTLEDGTLDGYAEALVALGADASVLEDLNVDNAKEKFFDQLDISYQNGAISTATYNKLYAEDYLSAKNDVETKKEAADWINNVGYEIDKLGAEANTVIGNVKIEYNPAWHSIIKITIGDESFRWDVTPKSNTIDGSSLNVRLEVNNVKGVDKNEIIIYNDQIGYYNSGEFIPFRYISDKLNLASLKAILTAQGKNFSE